MTLSVYLKTMILAGVGHVLVMLPVAAVGVEFNVGIGSAFAGYRYEKRESNPVPGKDSGFYTGLTSFGLKLVYKIQDR